MNKKGNDRFILALTIANAVCIITNIIISVDYYFVNSLRLFMYPYWTLLVSSLVSGYNLYLLDIKNVFKSAMALPDTLDNTMINSKQVKNLANPIYVSLLTIVAWLFPSIITM